MPYILDDTEVNTPVYDKLLRPAPTRKARRSPLAVRVKRLEVSLRHLQEHLPPDSTARLSAIQIVSELKLTEAMTGRAKLRVRRRGLTSKL